jgi:hypothetical protein
MNVSFGGLEVIGFYHIILTIGDLFKAYRNQATARRVIVRLESSSCRFCAGI